MQDYRAPLADMLFSMRHAAGAARLSDWHDDTCNDVLSEAGRLIETEIAPLDPVADAQPARLADGRVRLPDGFRRAYDCYRQGGWSGLAADPRFGGTGMPHVLAAAVSEMLAGACVSFQMLVGVAQGAMRCILAHGSEAQRQRYLPPLISGDWLATMCLTEPQAGSDLGAVRLSAVPAAAVDATDARRYRLTGSKIFISGGDQDLTDNILHLVLARVAGAPDGVRGLSLFLCPAVCPDGRRNALSCTRLEDKMGMHGSPTCQMAFDGADAELLGAEGAGLAGMFVMMNLERLDTALQAVGLASVATQRAMAYAAERRQGRDRDSGAANVPINRHADVRRMLLIQSALSEGCRGLLYRACVELQLGERTPLVDFLTPVCKAFASDSAVEAANLAIQIHGGYGYLREYRVEQVLRDARITAIYEGTNGIQANTLADRLLKQADGLPRTAFEREMLDASRMAGAAMREPLSRAFDAWRLASDTLVQRNAAGALATTYLRLTALLAVGGIWARLEAAAAHAPNPARTRATAAFYRDWFLPECAHLAARVVTGVDLSALDSDVLC